MSDRTLPGIHEQPSKTKSTRTLLIVGAVVALFIVLFVVLPAMNKEPYDPNNKYEAIAQCEGAVESRLKAPKTASFDLSAVGYGTWTVSGTVDAQNGFGATVRSAVQCTVIVEGESIRVRVDKLD